MPFKCVPASTIAPWDGGHDGHRTHQGSDPVRLELMPKKVVDLGELNSAYDSVLPEETRRLMLDKRKVRLLPGSSDWLSAIGCHLEARDGGSCRN